MPSGIRELVPIWLKRRRAKNTHRKHNRRKKIAHNRLPEWAKLLQDVMRRKSKTIAAACREVGALCSAWSGEPCSKSRIRQWAYGRALPRPSMYRPLATYLEITTNDLIDLLWPRPGGPYQGPVTTDQIRRLVAPLGERRKRRPRCRKCAVDAGRHREPSGSPALETHGNAVEAALPAAVGGTLGQEETCPSSKVE